jgi:hypothetical protein
MDAGFHRHDECAKGLRIVTSAKWLPMPPMSVSHLIDRLPV